MLNFAVISISEDFDSLLPARTVTVKLKFLGSLLKAFFWSDLNFADDETCYLDQCENDPCDGRGCKSTWDGKKAGYECEPPKPEKMFVLQAAAERGEFGQFKLHRFGLEEKRVGQSDRFGLYSDYQGLTDSFF